ncbi:helix-turn-helix domain-containing protein [Streptomyces sp. 351MFTsu5.1]|uniref:helix-turn-helix domain-containing protein n=1 Tax=Streptomyces sp. 351MFTsu5.1 TaxID=1172180 RepID=UPI0018F8AAA0|nr:helix-turn-helix transcriptional regulator [Streptomyces sp. 351MFTsu5.1]
MDVRDSFGPALRQRRMAVGVSLAVLAGRTHYSKGYLSRVETGGRRPTAALARRCDAALGAEGELAALVPPDRTDAGPTAPAPGTESIAGLDVHAGLEADAANDDEIWIMGMGQGGSIWFQPADRRQVVGIGAASLLSLGLAAPGASAPKGLDAETTVSTFAELFPLVRRLGQRASPAAVLPSLIAQTHTLQTVAEHADGCWRSESYLLASRYAEYAGWMAQEAGRDDMAMWWTDRAVVLAKRGGDLELAAYGLVRHALIRMNAGDALATIALARRAQDAPAAGPRVRGLAALREAQGHALAGAYGECRHALDRARSLLDDSPSDEPTRVLGTSSGGDPVSLATAGCLYDLGRPAEAAEMFDRELSAIPDESRRLKTRWATRQTLARAAAGDIDHACVLLRELLPGFAATASWSIRTDLLALARVLARRCDQPAVREVYPLLTAMLHTPHPDDRASGS